MTFQAEDFSVHLVTWKRHEADIRAVRQDVFIEEQSVPVELEWDGLDASCIHLLARSTSGEAIGTVRLTVDIKIGRLAVLKTWRHRGVGRSLMASVIARGLAEGRHSLTLDAQVSAIGFYEKIGFVAHGPVFDDAGIPHRKMTLVTNPVF